jgi:uncharacterized repeat protein (TIGR03803 family)
MSVNHWKSDPVGAFYAASAYPAGDWASGTGPSTFLNVMALSPVGGFGNTAFAAGVAKIVGPTLTTMVNFKGPDGASPLRGGLIVDAAGDLFGMTSTGGAGGGGTVFEIVFKSGGYASAPTTLISFSGADGAGPFGGLIADAAGNLFGMTYGGGVNNAGTVFELAKGRHGYASAPTTLVKFNDADGANPFGGLIADAAGDLFGTTVRYGAGSGGTVFEIAKTRHGYASAPTTLVDFTGANGEFPEGALITDAAGDLFGTTYKGGTDNDGTVFEIAKTRHGYASAPTTLISFTGTDGEYPESSLIADAAGDLFGTTSVGGANNDGTVFEIAKTSHGYAAAPTILVSFNGADGASPDDALIADAAGNLFGTTYGGGTNGGGTAFEIAKTRHGFASAPTTLVSFTGADGAGTYPVGALIADAAGDLFGMTNEGGTHGTGTAFEITNSGFVPPRTPVTPTHSDIAHSPPLGAAFVQAMASHGASRFGSSNPAIPASRHETSTLLSLPQVA